MGPGRIALRRLIAASGLAALAASPVLAAAPISFDNPDLQAPAELQVQVAGIAPGGPIPLRYVFEGHNLAPEVSWTAGPPGTKGYVVIMEDPDAHTPGPGVHWLVYDIAPTVLMLPGGMRNNESPDKPLGVAQGWNFHGSVGYTGPHPPQGDAEHHYHVQVFALGRRVHIAPGAHIEQVVAAMKGKVTARGEVMATYKAQPPPAPPKS
jgi:Raf kinase inhibitor-like YbhB/YbcL family protein